MTRPHRSCNHYASTLRPRATIRLISCLLLRTTFDQTQRALDSPNPSRRPSFPTITHHLNILVPCIYRPSGYIRISAHYRMMSVRVVGGTTAQCQCHRQCACLNSHNIAQTFQVQSQRPLLIALGEIPTIHITKRPFPCDGACNPTLHRSPGQKHVHFSHLPPKQHRNYTQKQLTYPEPLDPRIPEYNVMSSKTMTLDHTTVAYPTSSHPTLTHLPTLYILTFSTLKSPLHRHPELLASHLPARTPPIPHLYTLDCTYLPPPSAALCATYSGVAREIQNIVLRNADARNYIRAAVDAVLGFWRRDMHREEVQLRHTLRAGRGEIGKALGSMEVAMSVCCPGGTHRSVAVAEEIARGVRDEVRRGAVWAGEGEGVRVVCRHLHRVKGWEDPL